MRKIGVFFATLFITISLCISFAYAADANFSDVKTTDWFYSDVQALVNSNAISGYMDGTFKPNNTITRAEFSKVLVVAINLQISEGSGFSDTKANWANSYISTAIAEGIIDSSDYGTSFHPDSPISRLEIAKMMIKALKLDTSVDVSPFEDLSNEYTTAAYKEYLILGSVKNGLTYFNPSDNATRAEAATMIERAVKYKADPVGYKKAAAANVTTSTPSDSYIQNVSTLPDQVNASSLPEFKSYLATAIYLKKPQITITVSKFNESDYGFDSIENYVSVVNFDKCFERGYAAGYSCNMSQSDSSTTIELVFDYYPVSEKNIVKVRSQVQLNTAISEAVKSKQSSVTVLYKNSKSTSYDENKAIILANNRMVLSKGYYSTFGGSTGYSLLNDSLETIVLNYQSIEFGKATTVSSYQELCRVFYDAIARKDYSLMIAIDNYDADTYNPGKAMSDVNSTFSSQKGYCAKLYGKLEYETSPKIFMLYFDYVTSIPAEDKDKLILNNEQEWYDAFKKALSNNETTIKYNLAYSSDKGDILNIVLDQNADINNVKSFMYCPDGTIEITYKFSTTELQNMKAQVEAKANQIISSIIKPSMTELEKAKAIHDYLVVNVKYDYDNYLKGTIPDVSYTAYGILIKGTGVCQGYAAAFKLLAEKVGLQCISICGQANGGGHAWNMVRLDGKVGYIDVTFDDPVPDQGKNVRYDYFFISAEQLSKNHIWDRNRYSESFLNY